jgi:predicted aconitase with swiveling domain
MVLYSDFKTLYGKMLIEGVAEGQVLASTVGLSFWGGVDPETGIIIDRHHPLHGSSLAGKIFAIPGGRGSCTGSGR